MSDNNLQGDITNAVSQELQSFLTQLKSETQSVLREVQRQGEVGKEAEEVLLREDKNYFTSVFFKALHDKDKEKLNKLYSIQKAVTSPMTIGTPADGGYLVPALTDESIWQLSRTSGQILQKATVMPMGQNVINMPRTTNSVAGSWVGEAQAADPEKQTFGLDTLTPKKWVGLVPMSIELFRGARPAIGEFLLRTLARSEAYALDGKAFQNGNTTLTGIFFNGNTFGAIQTLSTTNPNSLNYTALVNATLGVDVSYNIAPEWYMSRSILAIVLQLSDGNGRPLFEYSTKTLLGYPVNIIEQAPNSAVAANKPIILFGDLRNSLVGDVEGRMADVSTEGTVTINGNYVSLFENGLVAIRLIKQWAFAPRTYGYSIIRTATS